MSLIWPKGARRAEEPSAVEVVCINQQVNSDNLFFISVNSRENAPSVFAPSFLFLEAL